MKATHDYYISGSKGISHTPTNGTKSSIRHGSFVMQPQTAMIEERTQFSMLRSIVVGGNPVPVKYRSPRNTPYMFFYNLNLMIIMWLMIY